MMTARKHKSDLMTRRNRVGYLFCAHWIVGLAFFFIFPLISSIRYAFCEVTISSGAVQTKFVGLKNFTEILRANGDYVNNLKDSIINIFTSLPVILSLSLFLAIVLNSQFRGRLLFRGIFFLPVIIANSVTMVILTHHFVGASLFTVTSGAEYTYGGLIDFNAMLSKLNMPDAITNLCADYLSNVFNLIWDSGVQTILFLAGLQSISAQLYEVGKIEGANRWEMLWFVEVPMLRNVILLVLFFTIIDKLTSLSTSVMGQISTVMLTNQQYDISSAMLWCYFAIAGALAGILIWAYYRFLMRRWE